MKKYKPGEQVRTTSYGENPQQGGAALFSSGTDDPLAIDQFVVVDGNIPSFNNCADIDRLLQTATHIAAAFASKGPEPLIAVGVKHGNPCGAAIGSDRYVVLSNMMTGNKRAIFGGLVMTNFVIETEICQPLTATLLDGIVAPEFTPQAIDTLKRKTGKCRFVVNQALETLDGQLDNAVRRRYVRGGWLEQENYLFVPDFNDPQIVKHSRATESEERDMLLAWAVGATSNSNTVTLVKDGKLIGNGVGQQDRVGAAELAIKRAVDADHDVRGAAAYSDSFFPFTDGVEVLIDAGITSIFTSSGSVRDQDTIDLCIRENVTLYMVPDKVGRGFFGH